MDLQFDRGDPRQPKGHALLYFNGSQESPEVLATYLVVLPVPIELGKYIPPLFASRMPQFSGTIPAVVPLPPVPERVESLANIQRLAAARDDDLICGGNLVAGDAESAMRMTAEIAQRYLGQYNEFAGTLEKLDDMVHAQGEADLNVSDVLYSVMGEHERLRELSKLTGQLRYAVEGGDMRLVADTVAEMEKLGKHLPPKYRIGEFLQAAQIAGARGRQLAALYMDRCYKLYNEDYAGLSPIEAELKSLQDS